jgi:putative transposase
MKLIIRDVRRDHPMMSAREMYRLIKPEHIGRDKFETYCFASGFRVNRPVNYQRTTNSLGVTRFENLLLSLEVTRVNQVWVSDITYYRLQERFYYLTFIMDLYTRKIVGDSSSSTLRTVSTTIPALIMALNKRNKHNINGLILHSDGGGQYYSKEFLLITRKFGISNSMCESVYENAHAERLNGVIKNHYIIPYKPATYGELKKSLEKSTRMYNNFKPHRSLKGLTPDAFERQESIKSINVECENNFSSYSPHPTLKQQ